MGHLYRFYSSRQVGESEPLECQTTTVEIMRESALKGSVFAGVAVVRARAIRPLNSDSLIDDQCYGGTHGGRSGGCQGESAA
jgi:hypothetical protein